MHYVNLGKIVNTHGIKGEVRIISDFKYKEQVFCQGVKLYIGNEKKEVVIETYRKHKIFDMLTFCDINNINDVIYYKGENIYFNRSDIEIDGYLDEDYIGLSVYQNETYIGKISSIMQNKANDILVIEEGKERYLIPNIEVFVKNVDMKNHLIQIETIEGMLDED